MRDENACRERNGKKVNTNQKIVEKRDSLKHLLSE